MPMTLIEGHYEIVGAAPDGDSIKFYPNEGKQDWALIHGSRPVQSNLRGGAQLRLDAVDALETHYSPRQGGLGTLHQPLEAGRAASKAVLDWLGFQQVVRGNNEQVTKAQPERIPGYVLTRFADTYGRCVAFAFKGNRYGSTGRQVRFEEDELRKSLNYHLIAEGHAYPTYYSKLFYDLRRVLTTAARAAREADKGVWRKDATMAGFKVGNLAEVQANAHVVPKLFRRLCDYFALNGGDTGLSGFVEYLGERDDRLYVLSEGQITGFDQVVRAENKTVRMTKSIEDLVFQEK